MSVRKNFRDISGQKFGRLIASHFLRYGSEGPVWEFHCECSSSCQIPSKRVIDGNTRSCGCLFKQASADKSRRANPSKDLAGKKFGDVTVMERVGINRAGCAIWRYVCDCGSTGTADAGRFGDVAEPVTMCRQCSMIARRKMVEVFGQSMTVREACELSGVTLRTVRRRLASGMSIEQALFSSSRH